MNFEMMNVSICDILGEFEVYINGFYIVDVVYDISDFWFKIKFG